MFLRKGNDPNKQAILYEVITENTTEERTAQRRRGGRKQEKPQKKYQASSQQLELIKPDPTYEVNPNSTPRVAESSPKWQENDSEDSV